jgi:hypothetical protein
MSFIQPGKIEVENKKERPSADPGPFILAKERPNPVNPLLRRFWPVSLLFRIFWQQENALSLCNEMV